MHLEYQPPPQVGGVGSTATEFENEKIQNRAYLRITVYNIACEIHCVPGGTQKFCCIVQASEYVYKGCPAIT